MVRINTIVMGVMVIKNKRNLDGCDKIEKLEAKIMLVSTCLLG